MLRHVKVDFDPSTDQRSFADCTTQLSSVTGPKATEMAETTQIADTMVDTYPAMTIVGRMGLLPRTTLRKGLFLWRQWPNYK